MVMLNLADNNLVGELPASLAQLTHLQHLDVSRNGLFAIFPTALALRARNTFAYDHANGIFELRVLRIGRQSGAGFVEPIWPGFTCARAFPGCTGLPPDGCSAYGSSAKISSADLNACVVCGDPSVAIALVIVMISVFLGLLCFYIFLIINYPDQLTQMTSTASIFIGHLQTMSLLGKLQLVWPPTTKTAIGFMAVDGFSFEAARPECMFDGETDQAGLQLRLLKIAVPLFMLVVIIGLRTIVRPVAVQLVRIRFFIGRYFCSACEPAPPPPLPPLDNSSVFSTSGRSARLDSWTHFARATSEESAEPSEFPRRVSRQARLLLETMPYVTEARQTSLPPPPEPSETTASKRPRCVSQQALSLLESMPHVPSPLYEQASRRRLP